MIHRRKGRLSFPSKVILYLYSFAIWSSSFILRVLKVPTRTIPLVHLVPFTFLNHSKLKREKITLAGYSAEFLTQTQEKAAKRKILFYIHGGAFVMGKLRQFRAMASEMAKQGGFDVVLLDYPLAPKAKFPDIHDVCLHAWLELNKRFPDAEIMIGGDSAGGVLATDVTLQSYNYGQEMVPARVFLNASVYDADQLYSQDFKDEHARVMAIRIFSPFLEKGVYVSKQNCTSPRISARFAEIADFPPVLIQVGSEDPLMGGMMSFYYRLKDMGVDANIQIYDGLWHVFQLFADLPESKEALKSAGQWLSNDRLFLSRLNKKANKKAVKEYKLKTEVA
jgi:monoterpene epsilon-lactone hydrolase